MVKARQVNGEKLSNKITFKHERRRYHMTACLDFAFFTLIKIKLTLILVVFEFTPIS